MDRCSGNRITRSIRVPFRLRGKVDAREKRGAKKTSASSQKTFERGEIMSTKTISESVCDGCGEEFKAEITLEQQNEVRNNNNSRGLFHNDLKLDTLPVAWGYIRVSVKEQTGSLPRSFREYKAELCPKCIKRISEAIRHKVWDLPIALASAISDLEREEAVALEKAQS